jgi:hypothetical protein
MSWEGQAWAMKGDRFRSPFPSRGPTLTARPRTALITVVALAKDVLVMRRRREGERVPDGLNAAEESGIDAWQRCVGKRRAD